MKWNKQRFITGFAFFLSPLKDFHPGWGYEHSTVNNICVVELFLLNLLFLKNPAKYSVSVNLN